MTISDINSEIDSLCDSDTTSYPLAIKLRRVNAAYEKVIGKILGMDGMWQFDDSNYTDHPIGTTDLVDGQQDYAFDTSHLKIEKVQILDSNGLWVLLNPIDKSTIGEAMEEYKKVDGLPEEYDKNGISIFLYSPPLASKVTVSGGLRVYFQRTADIFTSAQVTTGTKIPGFASPYHIILCYEAALPFCMTYKKDRIGLYEKKLMDLYKDLEDFYTKREKDVQDFITIKGISFR